MKIRVGKFVGRFELSIVLMMLLDSVIGEMYKLIVEILHIELLRSGSYVAVLEPIPLLVSVDAGQADVASDIELSLLVEEGHDVLLHYVCSGTTKGVHFFSLDDLLYLLETLDHFYSITTVCVFSWFYKPSVPFFRLEAVFQLLSFLLFLFLLYGLVPSLILLLKAHELFVVEFGDVESHGDEVERVDSLSFVVAFEVHEKCLFVG